MATCTAHKNVELENASTTNKSVNTIKDKVEVFTFLEKNEDDA